MLNPAQSINQTLDVKTFWILRKQAMMGVAMASAGAYANYLHLAPDSE